MRSRELTPRRQLVVRILIPLGRDILVIPLLIFPAFRSYFVLVHTRVAVATLTVVGVLRWCEVLVVEGWGRARRGAAHVRL